VTIKHQVEDFLSYVNRKTQGLCNKLTEKIDETQVDLQAIRTSINMQTKSLLEIITGIRENLPEELGLMIKGEAQMTKTLKDTMRRGLTAKIAEVEAQAKCERGTGTGM
jgi:hypothetical protein